MPAKLVGTTVSVICRVEAADDEGHALLRLQRVTLALNKKAVRHSLRVAIAPQE
jgi:hypothetical protein